MVDQTLSDHEGEFTVDRERATRVNVALDYVANRALSIGPDVTILSETRVDPAFFVHREDMAGTADIQIHGDDIIEVIDYKDGMIPVKAEGNDQLQRYAIGALAEFKTPANVFTRFSTVKMTIIQPKMALRGQELVSSVDVPVKELLGDIYKHLAVEHAVDDPDAPLNPGEEQCWFCRAKGNCSALANKTMEDIGVMFEALEVAQQVADKDPNEMSDGKLREIIEAAPLLRQLLIAAEEEALKRMKKGHSIDGLKVVTGRGSRAWKLPDEEMEQKLRRLGIPKGSVYEQTLVSPAQVEKLVWSTKGQQKQLSAKQLATIDKNYIEKKKGKLTVVTESDDREAVVFDASPMFKNVENQDATGEEIPAWLM
jgi:nitrate reductase NapAB chaperone NapD